MGPVLEESDEEVFQETESLVKRQQLLADNHWNEDEYYRLVVDGYPWATLFHDTTRDTYTLELPYGVKRLSIQPIPNKNLELVNETSEQILVDFPEIDCEPIDDSEEAKNASTAGDRFLAQDDGEQGTNEAVVYDDRVKTALFTATSYVEYWVDPSGGGYVPLQILAHPQAESPDEPLTGPDGAPTADYILRYVTAPEGGQFTDDPSAAAPQWQPKLMVSKWGREHIRCYPENAPADKADQIIILGHCTLGQGKKRWKKLADMAPEDLSALCDWTPTNYLRLLPKYQRARWKLDDGKTKNKGGASDERIMFYYHRFVKPCPDHPKGADVVLSGIDNGLVIDRKLLAVEVEVSKGQAQRVKETRCREIPVNPITPRGDPTGQDPTGKCYLSLVVGATEHNAVLAQGFSENVRKIIKTPFMVSSLSPVTGDTIEAARASGDLIIVQSASVDAPVPLTPPPLPAAFERIYEMSDEAINRASFRERAASGANNARERSGKALQIAVSQNSIGNSSMITAVNNSRARGARIKLELMMAECTTAQQVAYVGEDGANKLMDLHAMDFALIGKVSIKAGTGTGLTQDNKVQYLGNLKAEKMISEQEATDAARPSFSKRLGLPANPHEQYVSRAIDSWLDGPPQPDPKAPPTMDPNGQPVPPQTWQQQYRAWMDAQTQYEQAQAQYAAAVQAQQLAMQNQAIVDAGPPQPLGPETQNEQAGVQFAQARLALMQTPMGPAPVPPQPPQVPKPWTPFEARPNDTEPELSGIWMRKLSLTMSSVDYEKFRKTQAEWTDVFNRQYDLVRKSAAVAGTTPNIPQTAQRPQPQAPQTQQPATPQTKPTHPTPPTQRTPNLPAGA